MILYTLQCSKGHVFEAWFNNAASYDRQAAAKRVVCPSCGNAGVTKAPMAPRLARSAAKGEKAPHCTEKTAKKEREANTAFPSPDAASSSSDTSAAVPTEVAQALRQLRDFVERNCDYVGDRFAEESRKMHYGETEKHNIYGEATEEEVSELEEEGVRFGRIPWPRRHDS